MHVLNISSFGVVAASLDVRIVNVFVSHAI